jgi:hypothetical protein
MPNELSVRLTLLSLGCSAGYWRIRTFRQVSLAGSPAASGDIFRGFHDLPDHLTESEDTKAAARRRHMATKMTHFTLDEARSAIDAASLIFAHSLLDDVAKECCRLSLLADPNAWTPAIARRNVSIANLLEHSVEELVAKERVEYVEQLTKESLMRRLETLNSKCQPVPPFNVRGVEYLFDGDRVKRLDSLRHEIIHRSTDISKRFPATIGGDLEFLKNTCHFLMWMISERYNTEYTDSMAED